MSKMDIVEKEAVSKKTPVFRVGDTLKVHARYTMVETINDKAFAKK